MEYDLQRDVSCAEPSSQRHTAHVHAPKVSHEVGRYNGTDSHMHANSETTKTVYFSHELCKGKLIVDSGDTKSVAGLQVFEDYYEDCHQHLTDAESDLTGCVPCHLMANHL